MADQILMHDVPGFVTSANPDGGTCCIQAYGNFPRFEQRRYSPGDWHPAVQAGYTFNGQFFCQGYLLSEGQSVLFDIAAGAGATGNYATNVRVP
jgi:hypothetical protein